MKRAPSMAITFALVCTCVVLPSQAAIVIGSSEVPLERSRTMEANAGNLVADSLVWQALQSSLSPTIGLINSGGIRADLAPLATATAPASFTDFDVLAMLPFGNHVVVVNNVSVNDLLLALENAVSQAPLNDGRFAQVSGLRFSWNPSGLMGSRIIDAVLEDGTPLVDDGVVVSGMLLNIATIDFVANGGDFYAMLATYSSSDSGIINNDALTSYIRDSLGGLITATDYPQGGEGRILENAQLVSVPEPATLALLGIGLAGIGFSRHKRAL